MTAIGSQNAISHSTKRPTCFLTHLVHLVLSYCLSLSRPILRFLSTCLLCLVDSFFTFYSFEQYPAHLLVIFAPCWCFPFSLFVTSVSQTAFLVISLTNLNTALEFLSFPFHFYAFSFQITISSSLAFLETSLLSMLSAPLHPLNLVSSPPCTSSMESN